MKRLVICSIISVSCIASGALYISWCRDHRYVSQTHIYKTLEEAQKQGAIRNEWLPDFLPPTARSIREKHNYDLNTVVVAFMFDRADNLAAIRKEAEEVSASSLEAIPVPRVGKPEAWFPLGAHNRSLKKLSSEGFKIYKIRRYKPQSPTIWYLAVQQETGACYMWSGNETD